MIGNKQMTRRYLVKGGAWAAPAIMTTGSMPAYAASQTCSPHLSLRPSSSVKGEFILNGSIEGKLQGLTMAGNFSGLPDPANWVISKSIATYNGTAEFLAFDNVTTSSSTVSMVGDGACNTVVIAR